MPFFTKILQPKYYSNFHCIASNCMETCCAGWGTIVVEEATYNFYKWCSDLKLQKKCQCYVVKNSEQKESEKYQPYAFIKLRNGKCPFLNNDKLCEIQKKLGEEALSITCDTYPRIFNKVNGILQQSLDISCLEAAKLVLLNREGIRFEEIEGTEIIVRNNLLPEIDAEKPNVSKVFRYFNFIQKTVIQILQNRIYSVDKRLMLLSVFCQKLEELAEKNLSDKEFIDCLLDYKLRIERKEFDHIFEERNPDIKIQFEAMQMLLNHSLKCVCTENFRNCMDIFKVGLNIDIGGFQVIKNYQNAHAYYYRSQIDQNMYILENYLVNHVFKDLFPVGPQINTFFDEQSIRRIHMILIIKYVLLRTILIGTAGYYKYTFHIGHVIKVIQSFEKTVGHNLDYLIQAVNFMDAAKIQKLQGCLLLIKI